jgi:hypothetical protein
LHNFIYFFNLTGIFSRKDMPSEGSVFTSGIRCTTDTFLNQSVNRNIRAMRFPRARCRSLLSTAAIAMLFAATSCGRATGGFVSTSASSNAKSERLVFTPGSLGFGKVPVRQRKVHTVSITNAGDSNITLLQVITQGKDFTLSGLDLPLTLASGESFTFSSVFAPHSTGASSGSISFVSDTSDVSDPGLKLELTGMGANDGELTVDPAVMNFGTVQVGSSASQQGTLTAGDMQVIISSATSSSAEFTLSGLSFPLTIPAGASQGFLVTFTPQASGAVSATLPFLDGAGTTPLAIESLNGVGTVSQGHTVDLSWIASTSQNVIGYNVYRGTTSGGPYTKINSALDPNTAYTDSSVANATTYYYVSTAVNSSNEESGYSNEAQATIP